MGLHMFPVACPAVSISSSKMSSVDDLQSKKTFKFLTMISQSERVVQCFTRQPLASRAASTVRLAILTGFCYTPLSEGSVHSKAGHFDQVLLHTTFRGQCPQ